MNVRIKFDICQEHASYHLKIIKITIKITINIIEKNKGDEGDKKRTKLKPHPTIGNLFPTLFLAYASI